MFTCSDLKRVKDATLQRWKKRPHVKNINFAVKPSHKKFSPFSILYPWMRRMEFPVFRGWALRLSWRACHVPILWRFWMGRKRCDNPYYHIQLYIHFLFLINCVEYNSTLTTQLIVHFITCWDVPSDGSHYWCWWLIRSAPLTELLHRKYNHDQNEASLGSPTLESGAVSLSPLEVRINHHIYALEQTPG